uniref:Uncharacterized protein n=1 Tax=viral metagenome TaxID=1070528 RepID=A0A6M3XV24_9ZZZZ
MVDLHCLTARSSAWAAERRKRRTEVRPPYGAATPGATHLCTNRARYGSPAQGSRRYSDAYPGPPTIRPRDRDGSLYSGEAGKPAAATDDPNRVRRPRGR